MTGNEQKDWQRPCDPMGSGCKALSDISAKIKSDIYTHMNEQREEMEKKISKVDYKIWALVVGVLYLVLKSLI